MNRKVMFLFVATSMAFVQERMDLLDFENEMNVLINVFLIYLLSFPLLVTNVIYFFIYWSRRKYEDQYVAFLLSIFALVVICWRSPFMMSLSAQSMSIEEAKRIGTYLCSYRVSKQTLTSGTYKEQLQEVFLEKKHFWETYNQNRMWISNTTTDLRVIYDDEASYDDPSRTKTGWAIYKYKHFKCAQCSATILGA